MVLLGYGAKQVAVTTSRGLFWTAKKTPAAIEATAAGAKTAIEGGTQVCGRSSFVVFLGVLSLRTFSHQAYMVARDGTRKALTVSRSVWQRAAEAGARVAATYRGLRQRFSPKR